MKAKQKQKKICVNKKKHVSDIQTELLKNNKPSASFKQSKKSRKKNERDEVRAVKYVRKLQLLEANAEEDKTIKQLEKALKLKRKKKKSDEHQFGSPKVPSMFVGDGLDYILDVIDKKSGQILESDISDLEIDEENSVERNSVKRKQKAREVVNIEGHTKKPRRLSDLLKERGEESVSDDNDDNEFIENNDEISEGSFQESDYESAASGNDTDKEKEKPTLTAVKNTKAKKPEIWEDIYGRLRDAEGNVIKNTGTEKYVPPAKRSAPETVDEKKKAELMKITKQLRGLLNRLSESNMQPISSQIEEMFMKHSRNDMNETLMSLISDLVITPVLTPSRLILEQTMLIALLHANIGSEVGAFFLQSLAVRFNSLLKSGENYGEGKLCNNLLIFLSHLYNFKVTHCTLIFDVLKCLVESFRDKDIELIQLLLKNVGFSLRKDDPLKLKEIILSIQTKAPTFKSSENSSRVQFMLDTMMAIRNNNMYKIPDYDPSIIEHMRKVLRGLVRSGSYVQELAISLDDLLKAEERGRWWIVGSAWSERENSKQSLTTPQSSVPLLPKADVSEKILELARQQHMNTEIRKTIFCIIMTAEDYMDCFEKLLHLNLKNQQEREIINILLHCVLQEKQFNPYYAFLAGKFCKFARKYHMNLQFSLWDKFKELEKLKPHQVNNLAHFLVHLFTRGDLPISVLKVIHFSDMDKTMVKFFRQILRGILLHNSEEVCAEVFRRIAPAKNLALLREGLRLFMHHFLLRNSNTSENSASEKLLQRVKVAENALNSEKFAFKL